MCPQQDPAFPIFAIKAIRCSSVPPTGIDLFPKFSTTRLCSAILQGKEIYNRVRMLTLLFQTIMKRSSLFNHAGKPPFKHLTSPIFCWLMQSTSTSSDGCRHIIYTNATWLARSNPPNLQLLRKNQSRQGQGRLPVNSFSGPASSWWNGSTKISARNDMPLRILIDLYYDRF